jgi:hypothetical protein
MDKQEKPGGLIARLLCGRPSARRDRTLGRWSAPPQAPEVGKGMSAGLASAPRASAGSANSRGAVDGVSSAGDDFTDSGGGPVAISRVNVVPWPTWAPNADIAEQVGVAQDGRHGCANLVAHVGQELTLGAVGRFGRPFGDLELGGSLGDPILQLVVRPLKVSPRFPSSSGVVAPRRSDCPGGLPKPLRHTIRLTIGGEMPDNP